MGWCALAVVVAAACAQQLNMTITSQVRGAVYPVTRNGTACTSEQYAETPCSCYGGAARRADMIQNEKSLAIDFSSHFFGSGGLFYDEFRGLASAHFMHHCGYSARGLGAYDFLAGVSDDEPTGGKILAAQLNASGVVTVATNLDVSGDPYLEGLVSTYAIVYEQGVSVAVLSLLDCRDVAQASSYYGARCLPYMNSISTALSVLEVDRVVLLVTGVPEDDADALLTVAEKEEASPDNVEVAAIVAIVTKYVTVDLVLVDGEIVSKLNSTLQSMRNVAGQLVHVAAMAFEPGGVSTTHITLARESASLRRVDLDCEVPENVAMRELLDDFEEQVETGLEETEIGWISTTLDAALEYEGEGCVDLDGRSACGCAVAECAIGNLVADAARWYGDDADVALVDASRTLKASLEAFRVTRAKALAVAPDTADELCRLYVSGAELRKLLERSVEHIGGRDFLQVSSSLRFTWAYLDGVRTLGDVVYIHEEMMRDDATYAVVASSSVVSDDILDDDPQKIKFYGVSHYAALQRYFVNHHRSPSTVLDPEVEYNIFGTNGDVARRIEQTPNINLIHIAVLCDEASSSIDRREDCDHALSKIDLMNAADGYYDDLLPNTRLVAHSAFVTCASDDEGYDVLKDLATSIFPNTFTAVFAWCSTELVAIASNAARARYAADVPGAPPYVVLGPASTSRELSDEIAYPYVARLSTPDTVIGGALSELTLHYGWSRVALVYDDSVGAVSSAEAFAEAFAAAWETTGAEIRGSGVCVEGGACERLAYANNGTTPIGVPFSLADFDAGTLDIDAVVDDLASLEDAYVVVIASEPRAQRAIYESCAIRNVKLGSGFAWLTTWPSLESIGANDGTINLNALDLHEGSLGFIEHSPRYDDQRNETTAYFEYWSRVADNEACWNRSLVPASGTFVRRGIQRYCDSDGNPFTSSSHGVFWADAVLVLAMALDALGGTTTDAAAIYQAIKDLDYPIDSASGPIFLSEDSGDRVGLLDLQNLQIVDGEARKLSHSTVIVSDSSAEFVTAADIFKNDGPPEAAVSSLEPWGSSGDGGDAGTSKSMMMEIDASFTPDSNAASGLMTTGSITEPPKVAFQRELWCWEMEPSESIPWTSRVIEERWVAFEESVQDHLSELLHRYKLVPDEIRDLLTERESGEGDTLLFPADLQQEFKGSTHVEKLAALVDRGEPVSYRYAFDAVAPNNERRHLVVDVAKMEQVNVLTKKTRKVRVFESARDVACEWYWKEDFQRLHLWADSVQHPGGWIKYKAKAQDPLNAAYRDYLADPRGSASVVYFTSDHETTDEDDEFAHWAIDLKTMTQTNLRDQHKGQKGCERRVWPFITTLTTLQKIEEKKSSRDVPEAIRGKKLLWLSVNMRVILLNQDDEWGYGTRLDGDDGTGWFPMACVKRAEMPDCEARLLMRPDHWTKDDVMVVPLTLADATSDAEHHLVPPNGVKERQEIVGHFDTEDYDVLSVKRIQNLSLWRSYVIQLINAQKASDDEPILCLNGSCQKRPVFHGTDEKSTDFIIERGFNRDFCSPNVQHGRGVYFATNSRYSCGAKYAKPNARQEQFVFVCRAVDLECERDDDADDASIDDVGHSRILVAAQDHLAYPEYIVKFKSKHVAGFFTDMSSDSF
ncbi:hypothetical protein CTAYLR_007242 [Chrysophaeum taylorii]|uniref:Poly [ADP-ribose] polymerase n=1 Tax=Chrysophaeum taylorii TaxID=2483200 RepID=A0AAD7UAK9_9STRA|nr:hypothetical protein CTAYLR_007242 [Chrysophaeum taylorii]